MKRGLLALLTFAALAAAVAARAAEPAAAIGERIHLAPRTKGDAAIHTLRKTPSAAKTYLANTSAAVPAYELHAVHAAGPRAACLDLVFVADGFTASEIDAFWAAATADSEALLAFGPYGPAQGLINTHALFVASPESGADHPSAGQFVDTAFDTTFDYNGFERLAVANNQKVLQAVGAAMPDFDLAVVLVNDVQYGGSGGPVPVASLDAAAVSILRHELAHNIAQLADEYTAPYPGYPPGDPEPNVATAAHLHPPKWQAWVTPGTAIPTPESAIQGPQAPIGAYEGARYQETGMFRPAPECLMRSLDQPFCPVCAEALTLGIAARTETLRERSPAADCVVCQPGSCPDFAVKTAQVPTLEVRWSWNGEQVGIGATFHPGVALAGSGTLTATVADLSELVRSDPDGVLVESVSWQVHADCGAACAAICGTAGADAGADAGGDAAADAAQAAQAVASPGKGGCTAGRGPESPLAVWAALCAAALIFFRKSKETP